MSNPFGPLKKVKTLTCSGWKQIATALVKELDVHKGLWKVWIHFDSVDQECRVNGIKTLGAMTVPMAMGIRRVDEADDLTVDAAVVNPADGMPPASSTLQ